MGILLYLPGKYRNRAGDPEVIEGGMEVVEKINAGNVD